MADNKKGASPKPVTAAPAGAPATGGDSNACKYSKCRGGVAKYGFCADHFDQFKFGLLTKHGAHVPDFEKKFDHYTKQKGKFARSA